MAPPPLPRPFILPTSTSSETLTILTLPHPRTQTPTRYLHHPSKGLHEITKVSSASSNPRSWLFTSPCTSSSNTEEWFSTHPGHILADGALYISTPIDPLFLVVPYLFPKKEGKKMFLPLEDLLETINEKGAHWEMVLKEGPVVRTHVEKRVRAVCEKLDAGDGAYRPSEEKLVSALRKKVERMAGDLPASLEEEFVRKPLVRPVGVKLGKDVAEKLEGEEDSTPANPQLPTPPETQLATPSTPPPDPHTPTLRLQTALEYISLYLPPHISALLATAITSDPSFPALTTHLEDLRKLRAEAAAVRNEDFSRKRGLDDDEAADERAEKRRKEEKGKKKTDGKSRGVKNLEKVNTRGMTKLTAFFGKKAG